MFTTDGTAHKNGTKNEDRVKERFETSRSLFGLDELYGSLVAVIKKGGTQNKADLILEYEKNSVALSVKNSQGATHDWINTTRLPTEGFESVQKWIKENKGKFVEFARNYPKNSDEAKSLIKQKKLELEKMRMQQQLQFEAMKMGKQIDATIEDTRATISEGQSLRDHDLKLNTGGVLGAFKSAVRPFITYVFFLTFIAIKGYAFLYALGSGMDVTIALQFIWDENTQAIFGAIMGFWFGARTIEKFSKKA